jgi:hypothetical protein
MMRGTHTTHASSRIAKELGRLFGNAAKTVKVEMRYTKEIGDFINRVESAQRMTKGSKLTFK